jgi:hypothetical protein
MKTPRMSEKLRFQNAPRAIRSQFVELERMHGEPVARIDLDGDRVADERVSRHRVGHLLGRVEVRRDVAVVFDGIDRKCRRRERWRQRLRTEVDGDAQLLLTLMRLECDAGACLPVVTGKMMKR